MNLKQAIEDWIGKHSGNYVYNLGTDETVALTNNLYNNIDELEKNIRRMITTTLLQNIIHIQDYGQFFKPEIFDILTKDI